MKRAPAWRLAELRPPGLAYLVQPAQRLASSALAVLEGLQHGTVLAVGLGFNEETASAIHAGDQVFYEPLTGRRILVGSDEMLILSVDDILLVARRPDGRPGPEQPENG